MKRKQFDHRFFLWNGLIAFAGFLFRLIAGFELYRNDEGVATPALVTDMATYLNFAREILSGEVPREFYYQPFYYSVFLPFVQLFTGDSIPAVIIAQSLCGAGAVYLSGCAAARIAGKKAGYFAAGFLALSQISIVYTPYALLETMQSFWLILLLFCVYVSWSGNRLWQWLVTGIVLSFAILSRGNAWFFLPALFLAVWFAARKKERRSRFTLIACGVILLGAILPQLPFSIVNSVEYGRLRGPSTAGGNVLALGNTPEAPPGGLTYPESYQLWMDHEKEISIPVRILNWAKEEPLAFLELQFRKVILFWDSGEIPNNILPERSMQLSPTMKALEFIPTGIILTCALLCIFLSLGKIFRGKERLLVAILFVLLYNLAMAAFYNLARFRVPSIPLMCVLAGCGVMFFFRNLRSRENRRQKLPITVLSLLAAWFVVYPGYDYYRTNIEPGMMRLIRPDGINVPNRAGGRLFYDHGPRFHGGWQPVRVSRLFKRFLPVPQVSAGEHVKLSIAVVCGPGTPVIGVNGVYVDLSMLRRGTLEMVHLTVPYPEDSTFRLDFSETLFAVMDYQRCYYRTFDKEGRPLDGELVLSISTGEPEKKQ